MQRNENMFWVCTIVVVCICISLLLFRSISVERYEETSLSKDIIGRAKTVQVMFLRPIIPFPAVPLRDQVQTWVVNVPLTPFTSPLVTFPSVKEVPPFLLYRPERLTPARNQGNCGACWAFSVCDMLADRLIINTGSAFRQPLSVQQLLSCFDRTGCDGGSPEDAVQWMSLTGAQLNTSRVQPYTSSSGGYVDTVCRPVRGPRVGVKENSVRSIVKYIDETGYDEETLQENIVNMKRALIESGPFYCAMSVYDDLFEFGGVSVYERSTGAELIGGHAIEVIGYCDNGVDPRMGFTGAYWMCKNSWGKNWPSGTTTPGYFAIRMGVNMCGIESRCGFAEPTLSGNLSQAQLSRRVPLKELRYTSINDYLS